MFRLMIKTHNVTGLKYLCITKKDDWKKYTGSGKYWKRHLKKHGNDISTELLYESDDYDDFLEKCSYYSSYYNVVLNEEFANLKPENGYDNLVLYWKYATDEMKNDIYRKRALGIKKWHDNMNDEIKKERSEKISNSNKKMWYNMNIDERRESLNRLKNGREKFFSERGDNYNIWHHNVSKANKMRWANSDTDKKDSWSKNISNGRLNMSEEKKEIRKQKILKWHDEHREERDKLYKEMSEKRTGINNPNAKKIMWNGEIRMLKEVIKEYGKKAVESKIGQGLENFKYLFTDNKKSYGILICPVCGAIKEDQKQPGSFRRWHFDNCRKGVSNEKNC